MTPWRPAELWLDDLGPYRGEIQTDPRPAWNGWECPRFTLEVAEQILADFAATYADPDVTWRRRDDGVLEFSRVVPPSYPEVEDWSPDQDGRYHVGAYAWVWSVDKDGAAERWIDCPDDVAADRPRWLAWPDRCDLGLAPATKATMSGWHPDNPTDPEIAARSLDSNNARARYVGICDDCEVIIAKCLESAVTDGVEDFLTDPGGYLSMYAGCDDEPTDEQALEVIRRARLVGADRDLVMTRGRRAP